MQAPCSKILFKMLKRIASAPNQTHKIVNSQLQTGKQHFRYCLLDISGYSLTRDS